MHRPASPGRGALRPAKEKGDGTMTIKAPDGTSGIWVEPWEAGEIYAVAANWAQAGSPVMVYGPGGWDVEPHGRQVADFRHSAASALESQIRDAIVADGDEPDDDEVDAIIADAADLASEDDEAD